MRFLLLLVTFCSGLSANVSLFSFASASPLEGSQCAGGANTGGNSAAFSMNCFDSSIGQTLGAFVSAQARYGLLSNSIGVGGPVAGTALSQFSEVLIFLGGSGNATLNATFDIVIGTNAFASASVAFQGSTVFGILNGDCGGLPDCTSADLTLSYSVPFTFGAPVNFGAQLATRLEGLPAAGFFINATADLVDMQVFQNGQPVPGAYPTVVPETSSLLLLGTAVALTLVLVRRHAHGLR